LAFTSRSRVWAMLLRRMIHGGGGLLAQSARTSPKWFFPRALPQLYQALRITLFRYHERVMHLLNPWCRVLNRITRIHYKEVSNEVYRVGLHKQYDHATMIDTETGEVKARRLAHIKEEFSEFIGGRTGTRMVIESC